MNIEEIADMEDSYILPAFVPGEWYAFWDGDSPQKYVIARYSHSERTTPIDRHWTKDKEYFHHAAPMTFSLWGERSAKRPKLNSWASPKMFEYGQPLILPPEHSS